MSSTLIYPGASDDNVLNIGKKYEEYILYDVLPDKCFHFKDSQRQFAYIKNRNLFFKKLIEMYGDFESNEKEPHKLYFPKYNLTYYINTDADDIDPKEGDIYIKSYISEMWVEYYRKRHTLIECNSWVPTLALEGGYEVIHLEGKCKCKEY